MALGPGARVRPVSTDARKPAGDDEMHTTERLARALLARMDPAGAQAGRIADMVELARAGWYDDCLSTHANPIGELIKDAHAAELEDIARRAADGEFDATVAEGVAFRESAAGQRLWDELTRPDEAKALQTMGSMWVHTVPTPDWSRYQTEIMMDEDWQWPLETVEALRYCRVLMDCTAAAETFAAIYQQLVAKSGPDDPEAAQYAGEVVMGVRERMGRFHWNAGAFVLMAGMNPRGEPLITVRRADGRWWRWSPADLKQHVQHVQECAAAAWHDMFYRRHLIEVIGVEEDVATAAVADVRNFRRPQDSLVVPKAPRAAGDRSSKRPRRGRGRK